MSMQSDPTIDRSILLNLQYFLAEKIDTLQTSKLDSTIAKLNSGNLTPNDALCTISYIASLKALTRLLDYELRKAERSLPGDNDA